MTYVCVCVCVCEREREREREREGGRDHRRDATDHSVVMYSFFVRVVVPVSMKATALGGAFSGFHMGNLLGLATTPMIIAMVGYRNLFLVFGILGVPLVVLWLALVPKREGERERTMEASDIASVTPAVLAPPTVGALLRNKHTWAIIFANVVNHWGYFLYLNWMPVYFFRTLGLDLKGSALLSFLPWTAMAIGSSAVGVLADLLVQRGFGVTRVRKLLQVVAFVVPAAALGLLVLAGPALGAGQAVALFVLVLGAQSLGQAGFVANMSDIAPNGAGRMFGLCNTFGSLAGVGSAIAAGKLLASTGGFNAVFQITAVLYVMGAAVWLQLCTAKRQF